MHVFNHSYIALRSLQNKRPKAQGKVSISCLGLMTQGQLCRNATGQGTCGPVVTAMDEETQQGLSAHILPGLSLQHSFLPAVSKGPVWNGGLTAVKQGSSEAGFTAKERDGRKVSGFRAGFGARGFF